MNLPPERLGSFYLGAKYDLEKGEITAEPLNYDARDLTTHAVCFGMTGSGKTGLCVCLLEEAALDKVPALIIDPKGDITNLLLQFPNLDPRDFESWVNVDDARRKGLSVADYAASTAETWRKGLSDWGINGDRINQLKNSVEYTIFTPGSDAGIPISIMSSLSSPHINFDTDGEAARERISGLVAALIDLLGLKVDPVRSPEGILLSNIFEHFWSKNEDLSLEKLITVIQKPPFTKLGVFELDTFYPSKDRFQLAMAMNTLIASPSFASWLKGESLDIDKLLYNAEGKPRHSILYIAHLSDSERMFIVTLLLENLVTWVRRQQGTTSLRAILYFDEVFGFMPPVAEPSSKRPLLTLLKQARAYGLGVTLVTQNPVDIDYKGLTNAGTWFIGKLQAERDKNKVIGGLKGAIAEAGGTGGETNYELLINKLSSRVFLMHNIHQGPPQIINSRWAISYLRGPLTKPQISELMKDRKSLNSVNIPEIRTAEKYDFPTTPPSIDPKITQVYLTDPIPVGVNSTVFNQSPIMKVDEAKIYEPRLMAKTTIGYYDKKLGVDHQVSNVRFLSVTDALGSKWETPPSFSPEMLRYSMNPGSPALFKPIPSQINSSEKIQELGRSLIDHLLRNSRLRILSHKGLNIVQEKGEDERAFAIKLRDAARELRDAEVRKVQDDFEEKISKVESKMTGLERSLSNDREEVEARKREEYVGVGETVLGFFLGRKRTTGISTASRRRRMTEKAQNDVEEKQGKLSDLKRDVDELESDLKNAVEKITYKWENVAKDVTILELKPSKGDIKLDLLVLAWIP